MSASEFVSVFESCCIWCSHLSVEHQHTLNKYIAIAGFLKLLLSMKCVCVCVYVSVSEAINNYLCEMKLE